MADTLAATARYGMLDRLLHRLAFVHPGLQRVLGELESDLFRQRLATTRVERPVFVAGLPRAGTTLVLELLYGTGEFASFTYRQMPFVLNPLLWDRLGARSRRAAVAGERAHGDAMMIGFDSPEAFEEVLWINYLSDTLFDGDSMRTLGPEDLTDAFRTAYRQLAEKLVCLSSGPGLPSRRYLSKNNPNIARLPAIASVFDDATMLVCFRHPATHVASLHAQHRRFLDMHAADAFAERYMTWIGHHDFGRTFRPIRFGARSGTRGGDERSAEPAADERPNGPPVAGADPAYWLRYWIDAYRHVLEVAPPRARLVCFEDLLEDGAGALARLADRVALERPASLLDAAPTLRAPTSTPASLESLSREMADEAIGLYALMRERAASR